MSRDIYDASEYDVAIFTTPRHYVPIIGGGTGGAMGASAPPNFKRK